MEWLSVLLLIVSVFFNFTLFNLWHGKREQFFDYRLDTSSKMRRMKDEVEVHRQAVGILCEQFREETGKVIGVAATYRLAQQRATDLKDMGVDNP